MIYDALCQFLAKLIHINFQIPMYFYTFAQMFIRY